MKQVTVIGGGAWGTAVATALARSGNKVIIWCYEKDVTDDINNHHTNKRYLPDILLEKNITATTDFSIALKSADIIFEAVPVPFIRSVFTQAQSHIKPHIPIVVLSKGIEQNSLQFPSHIIADITMSNNPIAVLSGPSFAHDLARKQLTGFILATQEQSLQKNISSLFDTSFITITSSNDITGVQAAGAIKNTLTIICAIVQELTKSDNTTALAFTQSLQEMAHIIKAVGGIQKTVLSLAGLGDTVLSTFGAHSKNKALGKKIGTAQKAYDVLKTYSTFPEGVNTAASLYELIKRHNIPAPLHCALYEILYTDASPASIIRNLQSITFE